MAMLLGLFLLVYALGQTELRRQLRESNAGLKNQLVQLGESNPPDFYRNFRD